MGKFLALYLIQVAVLSWLQLTACDMNYDYKIDIPDFQEQCGIRMNETMQPHLKYVILQNLKHFKFVYPCTQCEITDFDFAAPDDHKLFGKFKGQIFYSNLSFTLSSYVVFCTCHMYTSDNDISKALQEFKKEKVNKCVKTHTANHRPFDPSKIKKCFHPTDKQSKPNNPMSTIHISGSNLVINVQLNDTAHFGEVRHVPQYLKVNLLRSELEEFRLPKVTCAAEHKSNEYEVKTCNCLKNADFFDEFPTALVDHMFKCGGEFQQLAPETGFPYIRSCREAAVDAMFGRSFLRF